MFILVFAFISMNSIKVEHFSKELDKLILVGGFIGIAIVNRNGLTILSNLPRNIDERKFGAMAATMFGAMETAISTFSDKLINITVEFNDYQLIILGVDEEVIIVSLVDINIDLGLIFIEIEECLKNLQNYKKSD
ncbi:MAG: roadblock/LC7 domain-containing protein [Candidatus Odinarchaeota archaeon]